MKFIDYAGGEMNTPQNDALMESACERFCELCDTDCELEMLIHQHFLEGDEHYLICKEGHWLGDYVDLEELFAKLWDLDPELAVTNPFEALKRYCEVNK